MSIYSTEHQFTDSTGNELWVSSAGAKGYTDPIRLNVVEHETQMHEVNARYYLAVEQARELVEALEHAIYRATR